MITFIFLWTLGRTRKVIPHRGTRGGGVNGTSPPWIFDMSRFFETTLPSVESLWSSLQDEVYFISGGTAGGLWRHQTWSPSWILSRIRNQVKTVRINNFLRLSCKIITQGVQGLSERCVLSIWIIDISKIQLVVYYQCCLLIGWATTRLYVIAHC